MAVWGGWLRKGTPAVWPSAAALLEDHFEQPLCY
jgi:hypothetical protein